MSMCKEGLLEISNSPSLFYETFYISIRKYYQKNNSRANIKFKRHILSVFENQKSKKDAINSFKIQGKRHGIGRNFF